MLKLVYATMFAVVLAAPLTTSQAQHTAPIRFDVVSIRPHSGPQGTVGAVENGYEAIGVPLLTTIVIAYAPAPFFKHLDDVQGLPSWAKNDLYDIRAKVAPEDVERWKAISENNLRTAALLQQMLRPMLAERCNLRIHSESTKADSLTLVVAGNSPALVEDSSVPAGGEGNRLPEGARMVFSKQDLSYTFYNMTMPLLANYLTPFATASTVEDRTSLTGRYKFTLHRIVTTTPQGETTTEVDMPVPFDLRSIGLKAERIKVDAIKWTVEAIDKPTEN